MENSSRKHPMKMFAREATFCFSTFIFLSLMLVKVSSENTDGNMLALANNVGCSSLKQALNGVEIAVSVFQQPPLLTIKKNVKGNLTYEGAAVVLMNEMADYFNVTFKYVPVDPSEIDKYGMEIALFRQMDKNEVDFSPYWFQPNANLNDHIDLDFLVWSSKIILLQRWPAEETRLKAPIRPFSPTVWISFTGTTVVFIAFLAIYDAILRRIPPINEESPAKTQNDDTRNVENDQLQNEMSISLLLLYYVKHFSFVVLQGSGFIPHVKRLGIRIAVAIWLLSLVVLQNGYTGVLTSLMTVPKLDPIFNTLEEVIADGRYRITDLKNAVMTNQFLNATDGTYKIIGDSFRNDKTGKLVFSNILQGIENVLHNDCVYPEGEILANYFIREDTRVNGNCRLTASLNPLPIIVPVFVGIKKGYPHSKLLKQCYAVHLWSSGIVSQLRNRYFPTTDQCRVDADPDSKFRPLTLIDLSPVFFIFCLGILLSILAFLIERIYHYYYLLTGI